MAAQSTIMVSATAVFTPEYFMNRAMSIKVTVMTVVTEDSSPSTPSLRLAELTTAMVTNMLKGMYQRPRSHSVLTKGTRMEEPMSS